jgi:D-beta-D-heptose 7-phosphate kinase/D-beta-D-heptose 1-phosphate adenosyltransferase
MSSFTPAPTVTDELKQKVDRLADAHILCIGDVMLDRFIYGGVDRISPEAPIPVLSVQQEISMPGGAGNVVRNISSLGAKVTFLSVIGQDETGNELTRMIGDLAGVTPFLFAEKERVTTLKTRYIAGTQHLLRVDSEIRRAVDAATEEKFLNIVEDALSSCQVMVLSDYGKGIFTPALTRRLIDKAKERHIPVIVDPKSRDFGLYHGATLVTPNQQELLLASGVESTDETAIAEGARKLCDAHSLTHLLVTRGKKGMMLLEDGGAIAEQITLIPAQAREVFDVSGAGDTALATLACGMAAGFSLKEAALLANLAAGEVVGKMGTATIHRTELKSLLHTEPTFRSQRKILPQEAMKEQCRQWQQQGYRVGLTNGCFDLLHKGHISLLASCRDYCDKLIVAVNSDSSVRRLKGPERPVNSEMDRAMMLASLEGIDAVVIFREDTPLELLHLLRPDVLIKGNDYTREQVVGGDFVESYGGRVMLAPIVAGFSTTGIIEKMRQKG